MIDIGTVTHVCFCGSKLWNVQVIFDDFEIAWYSLDMKCALCGATAKAPTPLDRPGGESGNLVTV